MLYIYHPFNMVGFSFLEPRNCHLVEPDRVRRNASPLVGAKNNGTLLEFLRGETEMDCRLHLSRGILAIAKVPTERTYSFRGQGEKAAMSSSRLPFLSSNISYCETPTGNRHKSFRNGGISVNLKHGSASNYEDRNIWLRFGSRVSRHLNSFYQFSRPHTVIGTLIGITSVSFLPVESIADLSPSFFVGLMKALVPSVLMNIYVVGLNQLFDVEIDKTNKPYLPIASGDFSMETGVTIVSASLLMSLTMGVMFRSVPLLSALLISFVLGSVYSIDLPLLRWKKHAYLAASCILIVRAVVVQLAFFIHMQKCVLGKNLALTRSLAFATAFMCFFSAVIALLKDIPDTNGDSNHGIQSFSVSLGPKRVFWVCVNMLLWAYGAAVVVGASSSFLPSKLATMLGHCTLAGILWVRARSVDISSKEATTSFYMFIWKLFYIEYFLIPFVR